MASSVSGIWLSLAEQLGRSHHGLWKPEQLQRTCHTCSAAMKSGFQSREWRAMQQFAVFCFAVARHSLSVFKMPGCIMCASTGAFKALLASGSDIDWAMLRCVIIWWAKTILWLWYSFRSVSYTHTAYTCPSFTFSCSFSRAGQDWKKQRGYQSMTYRSGLRNFASVCGLIWYLPLSLLGLMVWRLLLVLNAEICPRK